MSFWKRKITEAGVVVVCSAIILWWNPGGFFAPIRSVVWVGIEPVALFVGHGGGALRDFFLSFAQMTSLRRENIELSAKVIDLEGKLANMSDVQQENNRLRDEISASYRGGNLVTSALVVGYDVRGVGDWLFIDKGSADGIEKGMTVVYGENNLVGTVEEVLPGTSRVQLITHPGSVFNAHTVDTQAQGVIRGKFGLGIVLDSVLQTESLREGDRVVTSQLGERYPSGLYVGRVSQVGTSADGLFQQAVIVPMVEYMNIKVVSIVSQ